jgi:hypothetical protein
LLLPFRFKQFLLAFSSFQTKKKKKHTHKEKKTIEKKKNVEKGGSLPLSSHSALSFLAFASAFLFLPFHFKHFLLTSSSSSQTK